MGVGRTEYLNDPAAPRPNSLVPAAGVLAINADGHVLLQRRRDTGQWAIPMGKQEIGETVTQCAERETREETGVIVKVTGLLGIFSDPGHVLLYHSNGETRRSAQARPGRGRGRLHRQRRGSVALRRKLQRSGRPGRDVTGLGVTDWLIDKPALVRFMGRRA
jgi:8-oxo-dGTP pyrophosphatase MutT (NUDIX family)